MGALAVYFGLNLARERWTLIGLVDMWVVYELSVPLVLFGLLCLAIFVAFGILLSARRALYGGLLAFALAGFLLFGASVALVRGIRAGLPWGSHAREFDAAAWRQAGSSERTADGLPPRREMLGGVVLQLPGRSRAELEALLGPSDDHSLWEGTGHDLVYETGLTRDSLGQEWLLVWLDDDGRFERYEIWMSSSDGAHRIGSVVRSGKELVAQPRPRPFSLLHASGMMTA